MTATLEGPQAATTSSAASSSMEMPRVVASGIAWEVFLRDFDGRRFEWADGEVLTRPCRSHEQQRSFNFLFCLLFEYAEHRRLGEVFASFPIYLLPGSRGRMPDISFLRSEHSSFVQGSAILGPVDLVVELSSASTAHVDRGGKFQEYERGGVREYWLLDPDARTATFYQLVNGAYQEVALQNGVYSSAVMHDLQLQIDWLWSRPLPATVRRELGLS